MIRLKKKRKGGDERLYVAHSAPHPPLHPVGTDNETEPTRVGHVAANGVDN